MTRAVEQLRKASGTIVGCTLAAGGGWLLYAAKPRGRRIPRWLLWSATALGVAITGNEVGGKPVPFLPLPC